MCNTSLCLCLASEPVNTSFPTSATLRWISDLHPLTSLTASFHSLLKSYCFKSVSKIKHETTQNWKCNSTRMQGSKGGGVLGFISVSSPYDWMTWSVQMSSVRTWAGGRPALCLWITGWRLPEQSPPAPSLCLRGKSSWRLPASPSWTAPTQM